MLDFSGDLGQLAIERCEDPNQEIKLIFVQIIEPLQLSGLQNTEDCGRVCLLKQPGVFLQEAEEGKGGEKRHLRANAVDQLLVFAVERVKIEALAENVDCFEALLRGEVHLLHGLQQRPVDEMIL